ncbi:MAG: hypothetical protein FJ387_24355 [Verrucomicrobia bacterium]|nr:hypothetical protein [Verrucomicrobiota bacterium]
MHHDMTYDSQRGRLVLATRAGFEPGGSVDIWSGAPDGSWSQLPSPIPPPAGHDVEVAYDSHRDVVVLYTDSGPEVWELKDSTWAKIAAATTPIQCSDGALLQYDPLRRKTVLVGADGWPGPENPNETWAWDGTDWSLLADENATPRGAAGGGMVFDSGRGQMVCLTMIHNDTWTFDGTTWTLLPEAGGTDLRRWVFDLAYEPKSQLVVLFGGEIIQRDGPPLWPGDTWGFDGSRWSVLKPSVSPPPTIDYALSYFPEIDRLVMHGGWADPDWAWRNSVYYFEANGGPPPEIRITGFQRVGMDLQITSTGRVQAGKPQHLQVTPSLPGDGLWRTVQTIPEPGAVNNWEAPMDAPAGYFRVLEGP